MAIREILLFPNPLLKKKSQPIRQVDENVCRLAEDMAETMYAAPGVGLAAPQVGQLIRLAVIDVSRGNEPRNLRVLVNPEIVNAEGQCKWEEGCLSIPEQYEGVKRRKKINVQYLNLEGKKEELEAEDFLAVVLQHEIDHLDGILFIDRLSKLKRELFKRRIARENKEGLNL